MTTLREAAQQALEAMKKITVHPKNFWDLEEEITVLRAVLAQEEQEPVAWRWLNTAHFRKNLPANAEPGAWNPLFTHPPRREWRVLTEEDKRAFLDGVVGSLPVAKNLISAIEAKLMEKNA